MDRNLRIELHKTMMQLRLTEQRLAEVYKEQIIRTPVHFGVGQEAVAAGVCKALAEGDVVYSHHRCHNHYLAQGGDLYGLIAELMGKADGCSQGRGGSVHLTDRSKGFVISSAILGQTVAVATGSALAFKMDGAKNVAVPFLGDATLEEGGFWESLNYAAIHGLPVLFVCENNGYSTESPPHVREPAGTTLSGRVAGFGVTTAQVDGNDIEKVYAAAADAAEYCRSGKGPFFLECATYRWLEHVGPYFDHELGRSYRSQEEVESWMTRDPLAASQAKLIENGDATIDEIESWMTQVIDEIDRAIDKARQAPWPEVSTLFANVY